jgi:hypothetical protein
MALAGLAAIEVGSRVFLIAGNEIDKEKIGPTPIHRKDDPNPRA